MSGEAMAGTWDSPASTGGSMSEPSLRGWRWGIWTLDAAGIREVCPALVRTQQASRIHIARNPGIPINEL